LRYTLILISLFFGLVVKAQLSEERRGDSYFSSNKYLRAVSSYKDAYEIANSYVLAKKIAESYHAAGYLKEAANWYFQVLHFPEQTPRDYYKLINTYIITGEYQEAKRFFDFIPLFFPEEDKEPLYTALINLFQYNECNPRNATDKKVNYCVNLSAKGIIENNPKSNTSYFWTFENTERINGIEARYCYKTPGVKQATFSSIKTSLETVTRFDTVITLNFFDQPNFEIASTNRRHPEEVNFYAYNFLNTENFYAIVWDTGDGHLYFGESVQHRFNKVGKYNVKMYILGKSQFGDIYPIGCLSKTWTLNK